ncbi:MAG: acetate kinase [Candidatus Adiutrix intracellularis]|jgi:acetate kinase|nr:MAG: acetate kinase [Candidatus Adiutrix intracellularis]MDR2826641.1 acetate kinase [Candidatus Adiutrix intracellularis]
MIVLVINAGSSSVKFTCFEMISDPKVLANGLIERIGLDGTLMKYSNHKGDEAKREVTVKNAEEGVKIIAQKLVDSKIGVLKSLTEVKAIGHRVVSGGEYFSDPVVVDARVKEFIDKCSVYAPLHNPHHLLGINACEATFPGVTNVAVFDTAFHIAGIQPHAYLYAIPYELYTEQKIRRYGAHGTSHDYVSRKAAELLGKPRQNVRAIVCHLGNGASISAVAGGKCQDTSMGLTPLEGVIMGTRSGDIDPAIVWTVMKLKNLSPVEADNFFNKKSGMLALAGIGSSDLRDIEAEHKKGNKQCTQALETYAYRIKKYIGSYLAALGGADIVAFTAGIGENSATMRALILKGLDDLGIKLDAAKNSERSGEARFISTNNSPIKIAVIPTDEEQEIAKQTLALAIVK